MEKRETYPPRLMVDIALWALALVSIPIGCFAPKAQGVLFVLYFVYGLVRLGWALLDRDELKRIFSFRESPKHEWLTPVRITYYVSYVCLLVGLAAGIASGGAPEQREGICYLINHNVIVREITQLEFWLYRGAQALLFGFCPMLFSSVAFYRDMLERRVPLQK